MAGEERLKLKLGAKLEVKISWKGKFEGWVEWGGGLLIVEGGMLTVAGGVGETGSLEHLDVDILCCVVVWFQCGGCEEEEVAAWGLRSLYENLSALC